MVKLSDSPLTVMIQFENQVSAMTLINANGLRFGERTLSARGLGGSGGMVTTDQTAPLVRSSFDPFGDVGMMWPDTDTLAHPQMSATTPSHLFVSRTNTTRLSAESQPFVPTFQLKSEPAPTPATALEFDMGLAKNMFDKANLMMSKISSISGGPLTPERTHPADLSAGSLSAKSHRSDTTVVGEE